MFNKKKKIEIIAFGKSRNSEFYHALQEFEKRLSKIVNIIELPAIKGDSPEEILTKEEKILKTYFLDNNFKIILDNQGQEFSSQEFTKKLTNLNTHHKKITFFIGSSFGFAKNIKKQADMLLSLSKMTMPHMMARLILIEQIYRATTIKQGHPYHK